MLQLDGLGFALGSTLKPHVLRKRMRTVCDTKRAWLSAMPRHGAVGWAGLCTGRHLRASCPTRKHAYI
eukprot:1140344-Pelagomonas_calceolata.AAC.4